MKLSIASDSTYFEWRASDVVVSIEFDRDLIDSWSHRHVGQSKTLVVAPWRDNRFDWSVYFYIEVSTAHIECVHKDTTGQSCVLVPIKNNCKWACNRHKSWYKLLYVEWRICNEWLNFHGITQILCEILSLVCTTRRIEMDYFIGMCHYQSGLNGPFLISRRVGRSLYIQLY